MAELSPIDESKDESVQLGAAFNKGFSNKKKLDKRRNKWMIDDD